MKLRKVHIFQGLPRMAGQFPVEDANHSHPFNGYMLSTCDVSGVDTSLRWVRRKDCLHPHRTHPSYINGVLRRCLDLCRLPQPLLNSWLCCVSFSKLINHSVLVFLICEKGNTNSNLLGLCDDCLIYVFVRCLNLCLEPSQCLSMLAGIPE